MSVINLSSFGNGIWSRIMDSGVNAYMIYQRDLFVRCLLATSLHMYIDFPEKASVVGKRTFTYGSILMDKAPRLNYRMC